MKLYIVEISEPPEFFIDWELSKLNVSLRKLKDHFGKLKKTQENLNIFFSKFCFISKFYIARKNSILKYWEKGFIYLIFSEKNKLVKIYDL